MNSEIDGSARSGVKIVCVCALVAFSFSAAACGEMLSLQCSALLVVPTQALIVSGNVTYYHHDYLRATNHYCPPELYLNQLT